ncbi:MAG: phosphopantothenoylcysteine decarboxylase/phosphopantothenate--cysteine ligase [Bacteriovoracaceae bacterium]|jgi:phosphopantothenoylcysteine decarboxylase/phosphopantothenate--cysteine ligase
MRIILGVCGSISAYKSLDIARELFKKGHQVRVVLTKGSEKFVRPEVFRYLGCEEVYLAGDDFIYPAQKNDLEGTVLHVTLAKWCDRVVVAPLSANFLAKIVRGEAFDLLSSLLLALPAEKELLFFPAMNSEMLSNPFTIENLELLKNLSKKFSLFIHPTTSGLLACGDTGEGKLATVEEVVEITDCFKEVIQPKNILISTGATKAPLDSVRYLTNRSSGLTGYYLAKEALKLGHKVILIAGEESTSRLNLLKTLPNIKIIYVKTNSEMKEAVESSFKEADCYISSAAIGDIEFDIQNQKIKKSDLNDTLLITKASDILKGILEVRRADQKVVGFAAETDLSEALMQEKQSRKPVDLLVGTKVNNGLTGGELQGFATDKANYLFLEKNQFLSAELNKEELATLIIGKVLS